VAALGTGTYNSSTGSITGVNYQVGGNNYNSVAGAIGALQGYNPGSYFAATGVGVASAAATDSTAMGANSLAQGNFSVAAGNGAFATGNNSTALGSGTTASGIGSTAVGYNSTASGTNSTAIGIGAQATRANQVAIGTVTSTYTAPGITSDASRNAQTGSTQFLTTDANGNLANSAYGPQDFATLGNNVNNSIGSLWRNVGALQTGVKRGYEGTAVALAAAGGNFLEPNQKFAVTGKFGTFNGESGIGAIAEARINDNVIAHAGVGGGLRYGGVGAVGGLTIGW
jgi:hypothetical protein